MANNTDDKLPSILLGYSGPPPASKDNRVCWTKLQDLEDPEECCCLVEANMAPRKNDTRHSNQEDWMTIRPPGNDVEGDLGSPMLSRPDEEFIYNNVKDILPAVYNSWSPFNVEDFVEAEPDDPPAAMMIPPTDTQPQEGSCFLSQGTLTVEQPQPVVTKSPSVQTRVDVPTLTDMEGKYGFTVSVDDKEHSTKSPMWLSPSVQTKVGGMVDVPTLTDMEGKYGFTVSVDDKERSTKSPMWLMSPIVNKLYTNLNKAVPFEVRMKNPPTDGEKLYIRAVVVFSSPEFLRTNVTRCPNHAAPTEPTNHDFPYPHHVLRADHPAACYKRSALGRLSVVLPLDLQQSSPEYALILLRFMCLGSCVGGISRRPISIVLTLENGQSEVMGRKVIDVRVCACPTRDIKTDEQAVSNKGVKRKGSATQVQQIIKKRPKMVESKPGIDEGPQDVYTIKVHGHKLYTFMMDMMRAYYNSHPDYAQRHPDPSITVGSSQRQKNTTKTKERTSGIDLAEESISGAGKSAENSPTHDGNLVIDAQESPPHNTPSQLQHLQGTIPTTVNLIMNREANGMGTVNVQHPSIKSTAQALNVACPTLSSASVLPTSTFSTSQMARFVSSFNTTKPLASTTQSDSIGVHNGIFSRHVPVMQVTREPPLRRVNSESKIVSIKQSLVSLKTSSLNVPVTTTVALRTDIASQEERSIPDSSEMLAANVLAEGFAKKNKK